MQQNLNFISILISLSLSFFFFVLRMVRWLIVLSIEDDQQQSASFEFVRQHCDRSRDQVLLFCAVRAQCFNSAHSPGLLRKQADRQLQCQRLARLLLQFYSAKCKKDAIVCFAFLTIAPHIGDVVCRMAAKQKADFLVITYHEENLLRKLVFGSIIEDVISNCPCNVVVAKNEPQVLSRRRIHNDPKTSVQKQEQQPPPTEPMFEVKEKDLGEEEEEDLTKRTYELGDHESCPEKNLESSEAHISPLSESSSSSIQEIYERDEDCGDELQQPIKKTDTQQESISLNTDWWDLAEEIIFIDE